MTFTDSSRRTRWGFWLTLALLALALAALLILLPLAGSARRWAFHWLPGTGAMAIGLGATGFYAALVTVGASLLLLVASRAERTPAASALALLALLGGAGAFLAEHFLLRYVALEVVALCVALAPLAERGEEQWSEARGRWARLVYLVLRVGDAGLLVGILALWSATGTLEIAPALEAGQALPQSTLGWIVAGLLLAVWVKVGGWPLHVWQRAGQPLSLFSRVWLYRTLTPNLGLYLLYRVTPLIVAYTRAGASWVHAAVLYGGALAAAWAAVGALVAAQAGRGPSRARPGSATGVYLYAAQGGLALVLAALGQKGVVWLAVMVLTPLRVLLALAEERARHAPRPGGRRAAAVLYGLGGAALAAFDGLCLWWARAAGLPLGARLVVEGAVGLIAAWVAGGAVALWRAAGESRAGREQREEEPGQGRGHVPARRWGVLAALACGLLGACVFWRLLLEHLARVARVPAFAVPGWREALWLWATSPVGWAVLGLALWGQRRPAGIAGRWRSELRGELLAMTRLWGPDPAAGLERGLERGPQAAHAAVEDGVLRALVGGVAHGVLGAAHFAHRWIEGVFLEGTTRQIAQMATHGGRLAYQVMEQGGLEGLLRRLVRAVLAGSRWLQRRHTGRLRRNLIWVAASLALAVLGLVLFAW